MNGLKPGDILILSTKIKKSRNWRKQELTVVAVHKGKNFITVSNGMYRDTLDIWALNCDIKDGKARLEIKRAM